MNQTASLNHTSSDLIQINPVRASIARITDEEIYGMSSVDLVDLLRFSEFSHWSQLPGDLPRSGCSGLRLLALLARLRCRDEINAAHQRRGVPEPRYLHPSRQKKGTKRASRSRIELPLEII